MAVERDWSSLGRRRSTATGRVGCASRRRISPVSRRGASFTFTGAESSPARRGTNVTAAVTGSSLTMRLLLAPSGLPSPLGGRALASRRKAAISLQTQASAGRPLLPEPARADGHLLIREARSLPAAPPLLLG
mmetsp:Transcript_56954/g.102312  ORF Transcript_56954/g.102312 Transcript_56954/m.102312 type:complete len:133 (+) Transcript_56954:847-1245(+)